MGQRDPEINEPDYEDLQQAGGTLVFSFIRDVHMIRQAICNPPKGAPRDQDP